MPNNVPTSVLAAVGGAAAGAAIMHWWHTRRVSVKGASSTNTVRSGETVLIAESKLVDITAACLHKSGATKDHARLAAEVLVAADRRGIPSHGVNRCELYCGELEAGLIDGSARPVVYIDGPSTALVDGCNALGAVVSKFAMEKCIEKAKATGVGVVTCQHSNHFGIAAYWALMAMKEGLIGLSFTNTSPWMVPTRATKRAGGTNPICCCCPASGDSFELDMATTTVPIGKVEVLHRKHQAVPLGWGVGKNGQLSSDASEIIRNGGVCPLGGSEETAGYKGYGLSALVEIFCALLSGTSKAGPNVAPWNTSRGVPVDYGHCFICIDPNRFAPGFENRLANYLKVMRELPRVDAEVPVLAPGDPEKLAWAESAKHGVSLGVSIAASVRRLAERLGLESEIPEELRIKTSTPEVDAPMAERKS